MVDGRTCLFVEEGDGFKLRAVGVGRTDGSFTEILQGLTAGQTYVSKGAFTMKSELGKPEVEQ